MKNFIFKNNKEIPSLGLGTWKLLGDECIKAVKHATGIGYKHIDTADMYKNHKEVGKGIKESGIKCEDLFVTSKIWSDNYVKEDIRPTCERMLNEIGLEYFDLLLMHWPDKSKPLEETLKALNEIKEEGLIRSIGVSNFTINHIKDALATGVEFVTNQVEFHPSLNQKELKEFCEDNKILITAYSPLARGADLELDAIKNLAEKYKKTPAQIVINWSIANGMITIPKSASLARIEENLAALDFELAKKDIALIDGLNTDNRVSNPDFGEFDY